MVRHGLIRWQALSGTERFVCISIILVPLWWVISWSYAPLLITIGIFTYQLVRYKSLGLSHPSLSAIALLVFAVYQVILYRLNVPDGGPAGLLVPMQLWGSAGLLLWYVQSHQIRVRLPVIAWGFSMVALQATCYWLFAHFVLSEAYYTPVPNLLARLLDKGTTYSSGKLGSVGNFLTPYIPDAKAFAGLVRYAFFFPHPTISSFFFGFSFLIALDLRNRILSFWLTGSSSFLILICQSRNIWLTLPIVVLLRWILTTGRTRGLAFLMALAATASFVMLSIPAVTDLVTDKVTATADSASDLRKASTEDRNKIYSRTWENIVEEPPIIGHSVPGPEVNPGYQFARIGTESFILGSLLYKAGFLGTGLFLTFLVSFSSWLYKTREDRPLCCFLILLLLSLSSAVTEFLPTEALILILCTIASNSNIAHSHQSSRVNHA